MANTKELFRIFTAQSISNNNNNNNNINNNNNNNNNYYYYYNNYNNTPKLTTLWDFPIRTDRTTQANKPDIAIKHKQNKTCQLIDMSVPSDSNISAKVFEKLSNIKIWNLKLQRRGKWKQKPYQLLYGHLTR